MAQFCCYMFITFYEIHSSFMSEKKLETDSSKFHTNHKLMQNVGLLFGKTVFHKFINIFATLIMTTGFSHYLAKVFLAEESDILDTMKSLHLSITYFIGSMSGIVVLFESKQFYICEMIVQSGFHQYEEPLPHKYIMYRAILNERIKKIAKAMPKIMAIAALGSLLKEPLPNSDFKQWRKSYAGWFPIEINNFQRYAVSQIYHAFMVVMIVLWSSSFYLSFTTFAEHALVELKIVSEYLQESFETYNNTEKNSMYEKKLLKRIGDIVQHHDKISKFFNYFQRYYYYHLMFIILGTTMLICTLSYVITAPNNKMKDTIGFFMMLTPEVLFATTYCYYGQLLTNKSFDLGTVIYNLDWINHSKKIKFVVLFMLLKTGKPLKLSAGGLTDASLASLKEMFQTSYTYFNMIQVMMNKEVN